jgi:hypothetical protein
MMFGYQIERCSLATRTPRMCSEGLNPSDAIVDRDDARHCDSVAGSVTANSSGCATLVAMVQTADLWEGDNGTCRGWLNRTRLRTILV